MWPKSLQVGHAEYNHSRCPYATSCFLFKAYGSYFLNLSHLNNAAKNILQTFLVICCHVINVTNSMQPQSTFMSFKRLERWTCVLVGRIVVWFRHRYRPEIVWSKYYEIEWPPSCPILLVVFLNSVVGLRLLFTFHLMILKNSLQMNGTSWAEHSLCCITHTLHCFSR